MVDSEAPRSSQQPLFMDLELTPAYQASRIFIGQPKLIKFGPDS